MAQVESIRRAMHAQPFRPFDIKLVDGSVHTVKHPDYISVPPVHRPREITFYTLASEGAEEYQTHWIDLALILEVIVPGETPAAPAQPRAEGNGS
jgi:hypothetical protein